MVHKNYSDKELLELLEGSSEDSSESEYPNNVLEFIGRYKIVPGDFPVPEKTLFRLYRATSSPTVSKAEFVDIFSSVLVRHNGGSNFYYKIDKDSLSIATETFRLLNEKKRGKMLTKKNVSAFQTFLSNKSLKRGKIWVEGFIIYEVFKKMYTDHGRTVPIGYKTFITLCMSAFEYKRITENRSYWFGVNNDVKKGLTEEQLRKVYQRRKKKDKGTEKA